MNAAPLIILFCGIATFAASYVDEFERQCRSTSTHGLARNIWIADAALRNGTSSTNPPLDAASASSSSSVVDWKCSLLLMYSASFASTTSSSSSSSTTLLLSLANQFVLAATALLGRNAVPLFLWTISSLALPELGLDNPLQLLALASFATQSLSNAGIPSSSHLRMLFCASTAVAWIFALFATSSNSSSNPVLWAAVPLGLILQGISSLRQRRRVAFLISAVAATVMAVGFGLLLFSHNNNAIVARAFFAARSYAVDLDVTVRDKVQWKPGAVLGELLVYGFRSHAAAGILFVSLLPSAFVLIYAVRLRLDFESVFLICVLCDPTATLAHLCIATVLAHRRIEAPLGDQEDDVELDIDDKDDDEEARQNKRKNAANAREAAKTVSFFFGVGNIFVTLISLAYFVSWSIHRSAQLNMSFYALFGTHMIAVICLLTGQRKLQLGKKTTTVR